MKQEKYPEYRALSKKQKRKLIENAEQSEKYRKPNPQGIYEFHELGFFEFQVVENFKKIRLETYRHFQSPETSLRGIVFMFHGLNSHVGHGAHLAQMLSKEGFITVGYDYRGFGRSQGKGGYVPSFDTHLQQAHYFVHQVSELPEYKNLPKFGLGLSMGGMTLYHLTLIYPHLLDGVVLMAPALMHSFSSGLASVAKFAGRILPDKMKLFKPIYGQASKNPQITQDVKEDKHSFSDKAILSTMDLLVNAMDQSPKTFHKYNFPFLIVQGALDKLVNPDVAFELYDNAATPEEDKEILFYDNLWHDIWHQEQIYDIMEKVVSWINKQIEKNPKFSSFFPSDKKQEEPILEQSIQKSVPLNKQASGGIIEMSQIPQNISQKIPEQQIQNKQ